MYIIFTMDLISAKLDHSTKLFMNLPYKVSKGTFHWPIMGSLKDMLLFFIFILINMKIPTLA